ncbi:MAG: cobalamin B12-binding domain-containing protein [Conexivisphaerales archaeon]
MESYKQKKLRKKVMVTKLGLDGHDRGAKVIAHSLMEAGFEVVYLGVHRTVQQVVSAAMQEDVALLAVSVLSGAHLELARDLMKEMKEKKVDCPVVMGGIIPKEDIPKLKKIGIKEVFGPGTSLADIESAVRKLVER